jgi:micrococcal nuclease
MVMIKRKHFLFFIVTGFALTSLLIFPYSLFSESISGKYMCAKVLDGDTIFIMKNEKEIKIKLDGVDCPEMGQDFGKAAKQFTSDLVLGKIVEVSIKGLDKFRTIVAYVLVENSDVSLELIKAGLAWNYKRFSSDDPIYTLAEKDARNSKIGLWSMANPIAPWDFRDEAFKLISQKDIPTKISTTIPKKNPENQNTGMLLTSESQPKSTKEEGISDTVSNSVNTKYVEALKVFELELKEIIEIEINQLESRWDQFVNACLINSDSKKYLHNRKWFQFYED